MAKSRPARSSARGTAPQASAATPPSWDRRWRLDAGPGPKGPGGVVLNDVVLVTSGQLALRALGVGPRPATPELVVETLHRAIAAPDPPLVPGRPAVVVVPRPELAAALASMAAEVGFTVVVQATAGLAAVIARVSPAPRAPASHEPPRRREPTPPTLVLVPLTARAYAAYRADSNGVLAAPPAPSAPRARRVPSSFFALSARDDDGSEPGALLIALKSTLSTATALADGLAGCTHLTVSPEGAVRLHFGADGPQLELASGGPQLVRQLRLAVLLGRRLVVAAAGGGSRRLRPRDLLAAWDVPAALPPTALSASPFGPDTFYDFEVAFDDLQPRIWRRFLLRAGGLGSTFADLHRAIQAAGAWGDVAPYRFTALDPAQATVIAARGHATLNESPDPDAGPAAELVPLHGFFRGGRPLACRYHYATADRWRLTVQLRGVVVQTRHDVLRELLAGARAFPPENLGGPDDYADLVAATRPGPGGGHATRIDGWEPERFDLAEVRRTYWSERPHGRR